MQRYTGLLISKIVRVPLFGQYNYHTIGTQNNMNTPEQQESHLICSEWEEAIIKEHRTPDVSFDSMQKESIYKIHMNNSNLIDSNKQQSNLNPIIKSSN